MPPTLIVVTFDPSDEGALEGAVGAAPGRGITHYRATRSPDTKLPTPASTDIAGVWIASPPADVLLAALAPLGDRVEAYRATSRHHWNDPDDAGGPGERPRRLAFITRPAAISHGEFDRRWRAHAPVARAHQPYIVRYTQHVVDEALTPASRPFDGIGELEHPRLAPGEHFQRIDSPEGAEIVEADIRGFVDHSASRAAWLVRA